mmetsp:Transcript_12282/g.37932  ORF Transcript_12282/g.37932 Transcript_12282/m.37932 type:complete len:320 (-) Transcript_12282:111-1070(-)
MQALLPLCAREPEQYRILPPMNGEQPVILLVQEPRWFDGWVDVEAPEGNYSEDVWEAFTAFLRDDGVSLPSQPYQAALELRQRNLPHLQKLALGELEHIVRLGLGRRHLLSHHGDVLRPGRVVRSLATARPRTDAQARPTCEAIKPRGAGTIVTTEGAAPGDITDRDDLTVVLLQLMQKFPDGVSLSLMKHHVQSHCQRNLNEAVFKCSKLAEVFKLAPLKEIFPLEQVPSRNEIIVKPPTLSAIPQHIWQHFYHRLAGGTAGPGAAMASPAVGALGDAPGIGTGLPLASLGPGTSAPSARGARGQAVPPGEAAAGGSW